ncbi:MAG: hypothetical protein J6K14_08315 [Clostridia bacterium]|nr:hypothetical protein [Clostridia bacterium]
MSTKKFVQNTPTEAVKKAGSFHKHMKMKKTQKAAFFYQKYGKRKAEFSTISTIEVVENPGIFYHKPRVCRA